MSYPLGDPPDLDYSLDQCPHCRYRLDAAPAGDCPDPGAHRDVNVRKGVWKSPATVAIEEFLRDVPDSVWTEGLRELAEGSAPPAVT